MSDIKLDADGYARVGDHWIERRPVKDGARIIVYPHRPDEERKIWIDVDAPVDEDVLLEAVVTMLRTLEEAANG